MTQFGSWHSVSDLSHCVTVCRMFGDVGVSCRAGGVCLTSGAYCGKCGGSITDLIGRLVRWTVGTAKELRGLHSHTMTEKLHTSLMELNCYQLLTVHTFRHEEWIHKDQTFTTVITNNFTTATRTTSNTTTIATTTKK